VSCSLEIIRDINALDELILLNSGGYFPNPRDESLKNDTEELGRLLQNCKALISLLFTKLFPQNTTSNDKSSVEDKEGRFFDLFEMARARCVIIKLSNPSASVFLRKVDRVITALQTNLRVQLEGIAQENGQHHFSQLKVLVHEESVR
jgi:hypothetical protein